MTEVPAQPRSGLSGRVLAVAGVAVVAVLMLRHPSVGLPAHQPVTAASLEMLATAVAVLLAYLAFGRARLTGLLRDLALVYGLALLAIVNLSSKVLPLLAGRPVVAASSTASVVVIVAAACFVVASSRSERRAMPSNRAWVDLLAASAVTALVLVTSGLVASLTTRSTLQVQLSELVAGALFAAAAIGFARRTIDESDRLLPWIAVGCVFVASARIDYAIFAADSPTTIGPGDILRLAFYVSLLVGAALEIRAYWQDSSRLAVLEERRRIARDLHDGLAQELAYIATEAGSLHLADDIDGRLAALGAAAHRALGESRRAIAALTANADQSFDDAVAQAAEEISARSGIPVTLSLQRGITVDGQRREDLLRIVREAVTNAARHAGADRIEVCLTNHRGITLSVHDDGHGFDTADQDATGVGFGLKSMRERAVRAGADLSIWSLRGVGTEIKVNVP